MKFRVSLTERKGEIRGVVEFGNDPAFVLEAILLIIDKVSATTGVPVPEILKDLERIHIKEKSDARLHS